MGGLKRLRRGVAALGLVAVLAAAPARASADMSILDISPSFPPGPYTSLSVDRNNPNRVAVGTTSGRIGWSENAGRDTREAQVLVARKYDAMALRGNTKQAYLARGTGGYARRAIRLFISNLRAGLGVARWAWWMAVGEPMTEVSDISFPRSGGRMLVAGPAGIIQSDARGEAWSRTLGGPGPMLREKDIMAFCVAASPVDPSRVLAGTSNGLYVSTDGGYNFFPHTDTSMAEELVLSMVWDMTDPLLILAVTPGAVLQSQDGGESFAVAFNSSHQINDVALAGEGAFVATSGGLHIVGPHGDQNLFDRTPIVGAVAWPDGTALVATQTDIYQIFATGERLPLLHTSETEPYMRLVGAHGLAYALTSREVLRIGAAERRVLAKNPPTMALNSSQVHFATLKHLGLGKPDDVRLHPRWYAKLVPMVVVDVIGEVYDYDGLRFDGTFPVRYRRAEAAAEGRTEWVVWARWNLSSLVFGDNNVTNPNLYLESRLRGGRDRIIKEVQVRYREAATMVHRLRRPPADPGLALMWRMRLQEHAAYLEAMTGRQVVLGEELENVP